MMQIRRHVDDQVRDDVIVVGAGPAGAVAATVLARAGARVRLLDRASFPRDKLCGDTVNPGTLAELRRLDLARAVEARGLRIDGMRVTGPGGVTIEGRYPDGLYGRAILRRDLDWALVQRALDAGAQFEPAVPVRRAIRRTVGRDEDGHWRRSSAWTVASESLRAGVTIAADGRRSTLTFSLGLARHPAARDDGRSARITRARSGSRRSGRCTSAAQVAMSASRLCRRASPTSAS